MDDRVTALYKAGAMIGEQVFIGNNVYIEEGFEKFLTIKDGAVVSAGVSIILHDSAMNNIYGLPIKFGRVVIGKNAYIGFNTTILAGVEIGENSLIGANSLVTKDIPPNVIAYGSPARVIDTLDSYKMQYIKQINNDQRSIYLNIAPWRDRCEDEMLKQYENFIFENRDYIYPDAPSEVFTGLIKNARYLTGGWYEVEDWPPLNRWTKKSASVYIKKNNFHSKLNIRYFNNGCKSAELIINRTLQNQINLKEGVWDVLTIPLEGFHESVIEVTIIVDKTWTPEMIFHNGDIRDLGIAIEKIWLA